MGCAASKGMAEEPVPSRAVPDSIRSDSGSLPKRLSVSYLAQELGSPRHSVGSNTSQSLMDKNSKSAAGSGSMATTFGTHTRHGVVPGPSGSAYAKINQDRGAVYWPFNDSHNESLLCVFDGHGVAGEKVAELCIKNIPAVIQERGVELRDDPPKILTETVLETEVEVMTRNNGKFARTCGCTSIIVYLKGDQLWSACSGDSRAVMGGTLGGKVVATDLSEDCKPDTPSEMRRIEAAGGVVSAATGVRPSRVWANGKIGLAMSRSIGDGECKKYGVIADPEVKQFHVNPAPEHSPRADGDRFLIVASDGVWEFITSLEACEIVASLPRSASQACAKLVQEAAQRWKENEGNYRDDITAIVAYLPFTHADAASATYVDDRTTVTMNSRPTLDATLVDNSIYINMGERGIAPLDQMDDSPVKLRPTPATDPEHGSKDGKSASGDEESAAQRLSSGTAAGTSFVNRRLSISTPVCDFALSESFDDDEWESGS